MLPTKDSAAWRAIITAIQAIAGFVVYLAANPDVLDSYPTLVPIVVGGAGIASFVLNLLRKDVKNF